MLLVVLGNFAWSFSVIRVPSSGGPQQAASDIAADIEHMPGSHYSSTIQCVCDFPAWGYWDSLWGSMCLHAGARREKQRFKDLEKTSRTHRFHFPVMKQCFFWLQCILSSYLWEIPESRPCSKHDNDQLVPHFFISLIRMNRTEHNYKTKLCHSWERWSWHFTAALSSLTSISFTYNFNLNALSGNHVCLLSNNNICVCVRRLEIDWWRLIDKMSPLRCPTDQHIHPSMSDPLSSYKSTNYDDTLEPLHCIAEAVNGAHIQFVSL